MDRSRTCGDRFGKPLPRVLFASDARRPQVVDAEARDDGDQERFGGANLALRSLLPADESFLQQILGVATLPVMRYAMEKAAYDVRRTRPSGWIRRRLAGG